MDLVVEIFYWLTALLSVIGVILNIQKNHLCFVIWSVTNFTWMVIDLNEGIYAQGILFLVYFILALWGLYKWRFPDGFLNFFIE